MPHLDEGSSAAPDLSPGPVRDEEILPREIFNPQHIKEVLLERAVSLEDLRSKGFSVHRKKYVTEKFIRARIDERLVIPRKEAPWEAEGVAMIETSKVRQVCVDDKRAFVVIDTANEDNQGHASIYAAKCDKAHARELRKHLLPLLRKRKIVEEVFK